jgi:hypothetical protein
MEKNAETRYPVKMGGGHFFPWQVRRGFSASISWIPDVAELREAKTSLNRSLSHFSGFLKRTKNLDDRLNFLHAVPGMTSSADWLRDRDERGLCAGCFLICL